MDDVWTLEKIRVVGDAIDSTNPYQAADRGVIGLPDQGIGEAPAVDDVSWPPVESPGSGGARGRDLETSVVLRQVLERRHQGAFACLPCRGGNRSA